MQSVNEFVLFLKKLYATFPDLLDWLKASSPDMDATQGVWFESLKPCTFDECDRVLQDWINGVHPPPKPYERSHIALIIRQCVMQDRDEARRKAREEMERNSRESMPTFRDRKRAKDVASIADTLAHCMKLKMEGANDAVIELEMKRMLKSDKEPFDEPRYRCHVCLDNGVVCVWNPNDIDAIRDGRLQRGGIVHRAAMACNCSSGDRIYAAKVGPNSKGVQIARYHSQLHCIESRDPFEFAETSAAGQAWAG